MISLRRTPGISEMRWSGQIIRTCRRACMKRQNILKFSFGISFLGEKTPLHNRDMHISGILHSETTTFGQIKDSVNGPINGPINDPINDPIKLNERENQLLLLLRESPELTRKKLAERLGCSESTVKRELKLLSDKGILRRIGSKKTGVWVIHS